MKPRKHPVQIIGDRRVTNPRTQTVDLRDKGGNTFDTVTLSLELCGCGYSHANQGVGYRAEGGLNLPKRGASPNGRRSITLPRMTVGWIWLRPKSG